MRGIEEITAVHMNGAGQTGNRIGDRVNNVVSERRRIPCAQSLCACSLDLSAVVGQAAPEDIVLASRIDADNRPVCTENSNPDVVMVKPAEDRV